MCKDKAYNYLKKVNYTYKTFLYQERDEEKRKVLFLPPYLPDLNPIEKFWFAIKHAIKKALPSFWPDINSAIDFVFQYSGNPFLH